MCIKPWYHSKYEVMIPCGGCVGCRVDRAILWRNRAKSELILKGRSAFVTFTYDTEHLHFSQVGPDMTKMQMLSIISKCNESGTAF